jgi:hypothetical protein
MKNPPRNPTIPNTSTREKRGEAEVTRSQISDEIAKRITRVRESFKSGWLQG